MEEDLPDYSRYSERLKTFNKNTWPPESPVYIKELVESGFVYTGEIDLVFCFKCGITESNWEDDENPIDRHIQTNQYCPYIMKRRGIKENECKDGLRSLEDFEREDLLYDWVKGKGVIQRRVDSGSVASKDTNVADCKKKTQNMEVGELSINLRLANENMRYELKRFQSFALSAPNKHWPSPEKLANAGFYFMNDQAGMACFCCNANISGWESAEQCPFTKHRSLSPNCEFVRGSFCGNIPIGQEGVRVDVPIFNNQVEMPKKTMPLVENSMDPSYLDSNSSSSISSPLNTIEISNPEYFQKLIPNSRHPAPPSNGFNLHSQPPQHQQHPRTFPITPMDQPRFYPPPPPQPPPQPVNIAASKYSDELQRLQSFFTWPRDVCQQPMELAKAGFFYTGKKDIVQCFMCNLILYGWDPNEKPLQAHQSKRRDCPFLANLPGRTKLKLQYFGDKSNNINSNNVNLRTPIGYNLAPTQRSEYRHDRSHLVQNSQIINEGHRVRIDHPPYNPRPMAMTPSIEFNGYGKNFPPPSRIPPPAETFIPPPVGNTYPVQFEPKKMQCDSIALSERMEHVQLSADDAPLHIRRNPPNYPKTADEVRKIHEQNKERAMEAFKRELEKSPHEDIDRFCKICEVNMVSITFVPCGHLVVCESCALGLLMCPICRKGIEKTVRTFFFGN